MAVAVEALAPPRAESVPVEFFLDFIERDPLVTDEDRAFFRSLLTSERPSIASTRAPRA